MCVYLQAAEQMLKLYDMMYDNDVTMVEVNPMVEAQDADGNKRGTYNLIFGASLSEPHIDDKACAVLYIYVYMYVCTYAP